MPSIQSKGGTARAESLSADRRSEIARLAANARWGNNFRKVDDLFVCGRCRWVYAKPPLQSCPKCGYPASSRAAMVFGRKASRFARSQDPWIDLKLADLRARLRQEVKAILS